MLACVHTSTSRQYRVIRVQNRQMSRISTTQRSDYTYTLAEVQETAMYVHSLCTDSNLVGRRNSATIVLSGTFGATHVHTYAYGESLLYLLQDAGGLEFLQIFLAHVPWSKVDGQVSLCVLDHRPAVGLLCHLRVGHTKGEGRGGRMAWSVERMTKGFGDEEYCVYLVHCYCHCTLGI